MPSTDVILKGTQPILSNSQPCLTLSFLHYPQLQQPMAKIQQLPLLPALCFLSLSVGIIHASFAPSFTIQGRVYCDTCRAGFETNVTEYIPGAKVRMECRHASSDEVQHKVDGVTDKTGTYTLHMENDHQEEICEVVLVESPRSNCSEINIGRNRARVLLTQGGGMATSVRYANSLGFLKEEPLPECSNLLQSYLLQYDD